MKIINPTRHLLAMLCMQAMLIPAEADAKSNYDAGKPFGFCTRTSRTDSSSAYAYEVTGGGTLAYPIPSTVKSVITLKSNGGDMKKAIGNALKKYSVVVLDGSAGDFIVSSKIGVSELTNRTLIGINGATVRTQWKVSDEIRNALNEAGVPHMRTSGGTGGRLTNGAMVREEAEYNTRQMIINMTGDTEETYRDAGVMSMNRCSDIVIRNIRFYGPGSIDVGGSDLLSIHGCKNVWVDHCEFYDGEDGNFDITNSSDFVTVSWCTFKYNANSYMHQNTNLVGYSDKEPKGYLNVTFAFNHWGEGCRARMPMGRIGKIHMLNNYYTCVGNVTACINPRKNSEFLIEGNSFASGITHAFSEDGAVGYVWTPTNRVISAKVPEPMSMGSVTVPYVYTEMNVDLVPEEVGKYAGATLVTDDDWK